MLQYYIKRQSCSCALYEGVWASGGIVPPVVKLGTKWSDVPVLSPGCFTTGGRDPFIH